MDRALSYVLRRLLILAVGIFVIITAEFVILRVMPGDPAMLAFPRNPAVDFGPEDAQQLRDVFDEPLFLQYIEFAGSMLTGDFGRSYLYDTDVSDFIYERLARTLTLFVSMLCVCFVFGALFAYLISRFRSHVWRQVLSFIPLAMLSVQVVAWTWVLTYIFAVQTDLLPVSGYMSPGSDPVDAVERFREILTHTILPVMVLSLSGLGMFALAMRDGRVRAAAAAAPERPKFMDSLFVGMPNIQFMVAMSMCFVVVVEVFFSYAGLGFQLIQALWRFDYFVIQATVFLIAITVFLTNYLIESVVTLVRPGRRLDLYLGEDQDAPRHAAAPQAEPSLTHPDGVAGAVEAVAKDYFKSPVGVVSLLVLLGIVALAVVGPSLSSDEIVYPYVYSSTDLFLDGATALVAVSFAVAVFAVLIGTVMGVVAGLLRPYADGFVTGVMQGLIAMPVVCLALLFMIAREFGTSSGSRGYLATSSDFMLPVAALITLFVCHGFVSTRKRLSLAARGSLMRVPPLRFGPAIVSWALGGLKYGMPMTVVAVFLCDFLNITHLDSWGASVEFAYMHNMLLTGEWDYVVMPFIGMFLLVGSMFLVIDTLERVIRTRFASLV